MFNIYEWEVRTHQEYKQFLKDTNEKGVKLDKLSCVVLKTAKVIQIPAIIAIKLGKSFIDIVKEEAVDTMDTFQLIDNIAETKEEKEARKSYEKMIKEWGLKVEETPE